MSSSKGSSRIYFPGLNGLRILAATAVVVHHTQQLKDASGHRSLWAHPFIFGLGSSGVSLFFVLSGFLITFLLVSEKQNTGSIQMARFYFRRMLRIWPLYYLIVLASYFILPRFVNRSLFGNLFADPTWHMYRNLFLYMVLVPNIAPPVLGASQCWSIGVEEQFYLLWPLVVARTRKHLLAVFVSLVALKFVVLGIVTQVSTTMSLRTQAGNNLLKSLAAVVDRFEIESLAVGGVSALLLITYPDLMKKRSLWTAFLIPNTLIIFYMVQFTESPGIRLIKAVTFALLILQVVELCPRGRFLDIAAFRYLGSISYGVYMYHVAVIAIVLTHLASVTWDPLVWNMSVYLLAFSGTLAAAAASYRYIESPFLILKDRFAVIKSGMYGEPKAR